MKISRLRHTCCKALHSQVAMHRTHYLCNQAKNINGKKFQFYCSNLATPPFAAVSALLAKFLLKALKNVVCSPP